VPLSSVLKIYVYQSVLFLRAVKNTGMRSFGQNVDFF